MDVNKFYDFTGQTIIVTGGNSGIGKCTALTFAQLGANVYIAGRNEERGNKVAEEIRNLGRKSRFIKTDISDNSQVTNLFETAFRDTGRIDVVVNDAGICLQEGIVDMDAETIKKVNDINAVGTAYCCKKALEYMLPKKRGKIVNVASVAGRHGLPGALCAYAMSKAAVINLTQSVALTACKDNINVNAICPGIVRTPLYEQANIDASGVTQEERDRYFEEDVVQEIPMGRAQTCEDMAWAIVFLCSEMAKNITGQTLNVDGGCRLN